MKSDQRQNALAHNESGFTMIEATIAMLVTVVGLVSIAGMFTLAMKTNASSRNFTTATVFAQDKLEQLGAVSFQRLLDPAKINANLGAQWSDGGFMGGRPQYTAKCRGGHAPLSTKNFVSCA